MGGTILRGGYRAKQRKQIPTGGIEKVATRFNASTEWLFFGGESMTQNGAGVVGGAQRVYPASASGAGGSSDYVLLPYAEARLAKGAGDFDVVLGGSEQYAFQANWLRSKGDPSDMVVMSMTGDSMAPEIKDKDIFLVDQGQTQIIVGGIYAVGIDEEILIRYVDKEPGKYLFRSANSSHSPLKVRVSELQQAVRFIGRVIWWCRDMG